MNTRDTHFDYEVKKSIEGYQEHVLMHNVDGGLPWYARLGVYWFLSVIGLGWFVRIIFVSNSRRVKYDFCKLICS
jgi:hypothetical protein